MKEPLTKSWRRFRLWLRMVFSPRARVAVVPGADCAHDADPAHQMRRLLATVGDPRRFAQILAGFANCAGCSTAVLTEVVYTLAGLVLDHDQDQPGADEPPGCTCEKPVSAEVVAMSLVLTVDSHDPDAMGLVLQKILTCPVCMLSVVVTLVNANKSILDETNVLWRPMVERRLMAALDGDQDGAL